MSSNIIKADNGASSGVTGIVQTAGSDGTLLLQTTTSGGTATTAVTIDNSQNTTLAGNLTFASGKGLTFNNSSALTNSQLNDYETGTWTPSLNFGGNAVGLTYGSRPGTYTKIGNIVSATFQMSISAGGSSTGVATISGLPFSSSPSQAYTAFLQSDTVTFVGTALVYLSTSSSTLAAYYESSGGLSVAMTNSNIVTNSTLRATIVYQATF